MFFLWFSSTLLLHVLLQLIKLQIIMTLISLSFIGHFQTIDRIVSHPLSSIHLLCATSMAGTILGPGDAA